MAAKKVKAVMLDFTHIGLKPNGKPVRDAQGRVGDAQGGRPRELIITERTVLDDRQRKQIRRRARRGTKLIAQAELESMYKPIEEWDAEELARGRPRDRKGGFSGKAPPYVTRAFHEQIVRRFQVVVKEQMAVHTVEALQVVRKILDDDNVDLKGKPLVPYSTKLDAAKYLIDHVVGRPTQRIEQDVSVKLQSMLGSAMVNPSGELTQGSKPIDVIDAEIVEDDEGTV
jgi:hypothetical protein